MENKKEALTVKSLFDKDEVKKRFNEIMGANAQGFIVSVLQCVASNELLKKCDPLSIYNAAAIAATLNLEINNNLGFAYIIPYKSKKEIEGKWVEIYLAQFQIGYKGFKQLALRTGQISRMNATDVRQGELKHFDRLSGDMEFAWIQDVTERNKLLIIGYVSYIALHSGYKQTFYMTEEEIEQHASKYSQNYKKFKTGLWKDDRHSMALKTVTKLNISKSAPMSISLANALITDQAVIKDLDTLEVEYVDNSENKLEIIETKKDTIKENKKQGGGAPEMM